MSIERKTSVFQVRVEPALLEAFKVAAEHEGFTVSDAIRRFMAWRVKAYEEANKGPVPVPAKDERLRAYESKKEARRQGRIRK